MVQGSIACGRPSWGQTRLLAAADVPVASTGGWRRRRSHGEVRALGTKGAGTKGAQSNLHGPIIVGGAWSSLSMAVMKQAPEAERRWQGVRRCWEGHDQGGPWSLLRMLFPFQVQHTATSISPTLSSSPPLSPAWGHAAISCPCFVPNPLPARGVPAAASGGVSQGTAPCRHRHRGQPG